MGCESDEGGEADEVANDLEAVTDEEEPEEQSTEMATNMSLAAAPNDDNDDDDGHDAAMSTPQKPVSQSAAAVVAAAGIRMCGTNGCSRPARGSISVCCRTCVGSQGLRHGSHCRKASI